MTPAAVAQAVNTAEADAGVTQPTVAAALTTDAPVPGGTVGGSYTTTPVAAAGHVERRQAAPCRRA